MRYKKFGKTGWDVSVLTIGTWVAGGIRWGDVDKNSCIDAIHAMIDMGVNHIDTAQPYNMGRAEEVVGEALRGVRDKVYLTTKFALKNTKPEGGLGGCEFHCTKDKILKMFEQQLERLKTDYIDLYIHHWPPTPWNCPGEVLDEAGIEMRIAGGLEVVNQLKREGRVGHIGVSNFDSKQLDIARKYADIEVTQPSYSMVNRRNEESMRYAHDLGIGVMTYGSLGGGILSGMYRTLPYFEPGDLRVEGYTHFVEPNFSKAMRLLESLDVIAERRNVPIPQIVINWNTQKDFVDTAIVGVRNVDEAAQNCKGLDWMLTPDEMRAIDKAILDTVG